MNKRTQPIRARDLIDELVGPRLEERARRAALQGEDGTATAWALEPADTDRPKHLRAQDRRRDPWNRR